MSDISPVIHRFDHLATQPQVLSLSLALSPFLLIPKVMFVVRWLKSDRLRIYRYFVITPATTAVPKGPFSFVTDPLRSERENRAPELTQPISRKRAVAISIGILFLAVLIGIVWPWFAYGWGLSSGRSADFREVWVTQGGVKFWLSWSVYQMSFAAMFLGMAYCVLREYVRFARAWLNGLLARARSN